MRSQRSEVRGFTLVEVLVALAIVSIALMASLRVAGGGTQGAAELRTRLFAGWVAENVLAEQRARAIWLAPGLHQGSQRQGGIDFVWRAEVASTPNGAFRRVDVAVATATANTHVLVRLVGFLVRPP
jgi:general secretion pathway protein I